MKKTIAYSFLFVILFFSCHLKAQWSADVTVNTAISTIAFEKINVHAVSDNHGGSVITWQDKRNGNWDIYVQRINNLGVVQWTNNGVLVSGLSGDEINPQICNSNFDGVIITWQYQDKIFLQRISDAGLIEWGVNGKSVFNNYSNFQGIQAMPQIKPDGFGGVILAWFEKREILFDDFDIYSQRLSSVGSILYLDHALLICDAVGNQYDPRIAVDELGGAIISWHDPRSSVTGRDVYVQKINEMGVVQWANNGVKICDSPNDQYRVSTVSDDAGGAIIHWADERNPVSPAFYAQKINASGVVQWTSNGVETYTLTEINYNYMDPDILKDGLGGFFMSWANNTTIGGEYDVLTQHISTTGTKLWTSSGLSLSGTGDQVNPKLCSDSLGGIIVTWEDFRDGVSKDIYAQKVDYNGIVSWSNGGVEISKANLNQVKPQICSDESGGAIITFLDSRNGDHSIYSQNILSNGYLDITEVNDGKVTIFPNPSNGKFIISAESVNSLSVEITNVLGEIVYLSAIVDENFICDLSNQNPGVYFVNVFHNDQKSVSKIIIQ